VQTEDRTVYKQRLMVKRRYSWGFSSSDCALAVWRDIVSNFACRLLLALSIICTLFMSCRTVTESGSVGSSLLVAYGGLIDQKYTEGDLTTVLRYKISSVQYGMAPPGNVLSVHCYPSTLPSNGPPPRAILILLPYDLDGTFSHLEWTRLMFQCVGNDAHYGILADIPRNRSRILPVLSRLYDNARSLRMSEAEAIERVHLYMADKGIPFESEGSFASRPEWGYGWTVEVMRRPAFIGSDMFVDIADDGRIRYARGLDQENTISTPEKSNDGSD